MEIPLACGWWDGKILPSWWASLGLTFRPSASTPALVMPTTPGGLSRPTGLRPVGFLQSRPSGIENALYIWEWQSHRPSTEGSGNPPPSWGHLSGLRSGLRPPLRPSRCPHLGGGFPHPSAFGRCNSYNPAMVVSIPP